MKNQKKNELTISQVASLGGKARWIGVSIADMSAQMSRIARLPRKSKSKNASNSLCRHAKKDSD